MLLNLCRGIADRNPVIQLPCGFRPPLGPIPSKGRIPDGGIVPQKAVPHGGEHERNADLGVPLRQLELAPLQIQKGQAVLPHPVESLSFSGCKVHGQCILIRPLPRLILTARDLQRAVRILLAIAPAKAVPVILLQQHRPVRPPENQLPGGAYFTDQLSTADGAPVVCLIQPDHDLCILRRQQGGQALLRPLLRETVVLRCPDPKAVRPPGLDSQQLLVKSPAKCVVLSPDHVVPP